MKKLLIAALAAVACAGDVLADEKPASGLAEESSWTDAFWGFGNYGLYSGYQLYGSLVNREPTLQGYAEVNANLSISDVSLGYLGLGLWSNSDLTCYRKDKYGRIFNEWDFNIHWGTTFWFDDDKTWGLDYRTSIVWYYYPHRMYQKGYRDGRRQDTATTMDWNHSFALVNPFVTPFLDVVHEYHESDGNLLQFGLKRSDMIGDSLKVTPSLTFVWRNSHYNWCFPTGFGTMKHGTGLATMKIGLDLDYQISEHFGIFAKVAYCSVLDKDLRDNCDHRDQAFDGCYYGIKDKDFAWGGIGVSFNF